MYQHLYLACFAWRVAAEGKVGGTACFSNSQCQSNSCHKVSSDATTAVCCHTDLGVSHLWRGHQYCWGVAFPGARCFDNRNCESGTCKGGRCVVHCETSAWKAWSPCDKKCGNGTQSRQRTVVQEPKYRGNRCGELEEKQHCNVDPCPIHCEMSDWVIWSLCSETCGNGTQSRQRTVKQQPLHGGVECGELEETQFCNFDPCPIDCQLSAWKAWSPCDKECGNGTQSSQRTVTQEPLHRGSACDELEKMQACNVHPCPVDCQMSDWAILIPCSKTCGNGTLSRQRTVTQQPFHGGVACGELEETQECNVDPCPICQSVSISRLTFSGNGINLAGTDDSGGGNYADVYCEFWVGEAKAITTSRISWSWPSWSDLGTVHNNGSDIFILCADSDVNMDDFVGFTSFTPQFSNVDAPHVATDFGWKQSFNALSSKIKGGKTSHGGMTYQGVTLTCRYQCAGH